MTVSHLELKPVCAIVHEKKFMPVGCDKCDVCRLNYVMQLLQTSSSSACSSRVSCAILM